MSRRADRRLAARGVHAVALAWRAAPGVLCGAVATNLIAGAAPILAAWLVKLILDQLAGGSAPADVVGLAAALALTALVTGVLPHLTGYLQSELQRRTGLSAVEGVYHAVGRFTGLGRLEDPAFLDRLRLAQQSAGVAPAHTVTGILSMARSALTVAGFVGSLVALSPTMTVAVVLAAVPALLAELALSRRRARTMWEISPTERREAFYGSLLTDVGAAKEVRLFNIGGLLRDRMLTERRAADLGRRALDQRDLRAQGGLALLAGVVAAAGLVWAVNAAQSGLLSIGDISMFMAAVAGVQTGLAGLVRELAGTHHNLLLYGHYLEVVHAEPDLPLPVQPRRLPALRHSIEFRDVWFRYSPDHQWVLRGVNLVIPAGSAVGLVGLNGAGKSTLVKLLCRFYDPTRGAVLWDGVDLREIDPVDLRERIGAVFQDYVEYDLSVTENIGLGDVSALDDDARIKDAACRAGIAETIDKLPQGYQTLLTRMFVDERDKADPATGVLLSGGQWQRLALARAFVRDGRDLLILDEPSAGLDAEAEYEIHHRLRDQRQGRTSLLISHRLGALRDADRIVVIEDGVITEEGDHSELLRTGGRYARLFTMQASGYTVDEGPATPPVDQAGQVAHVAQAGL